MSINDFVKTTKMKLIIGNRKELNGFPEFSTSHILENLSIYKMGDWPVLSQLFVLQK
jgi:hypothetical protein